MTSRIYYGWWIVIALFLVLAVSSGLGFYNLSVYMNVIAESRGFAVSTVSGAVGLFFVAAGIAGLWVARVIERYDPRWPIAIGAVVGGGTIALAGQVSEVWQIYACFVAFGFSYGGVSLVPATTLVTRWFVERRSVALSVASTGLSAGGVLITPISARLLESTELATAMPLLGTCFVVGIVPIALLVLRPWPDQATAGAAAAGVAEGTSRDEAVRTRLFVLMTFAYVLIMLAQVGGIAHLYSLVEVRADSERAALAVALMASASIVGRLAGGWLVLWFSTGVFTMINLLVQLVSLAWLALAGSDLALLVGTVVFGSSVGNLLMLQPLLLAEAFGMRDYSRIFALANAITMVGVATGPLLMGLVFDFAGGYEVAYGMAALLSTIALAALLGGGARTRG